MQIEKLIGDGLGSVVGGLCYVGSAGRGARFFHPEGEAYVARVESVPGIDSVAETFSQRLSGPGLVRMSAALWKGQREWPDILGAAIRFGWNPHAPLRTDGTQDLLLITAKHFWTLPWALLITEVGDFLDNSYYSILSFQTEAGELEFRLVPQPGSRPAGSTRSQRLADSISKGEAAFMLQARPTAMSPTLGSKQVWRVVAIVQLLEKAHVDDRQLLFTPFNAGRGIHPVGLANRVRRLTYLASKAGRSRP